LERRHYILGKSRWSPYLVVHRTFALILFPRIRHVHDVDGIW
jgi:hypothetical protein